MRQEQFERQHAAEWDEFEAWIKARRPSRRSRRAGPVFADEAFARRYRAVCSQLALARSRGYGPALVDRLHGMARDGHDELYGGDPGWRRRWLAWLVGGFARDVRAQWRYVLAALILFAGPCLGLMIAVRQAPEFAWVVLPGELLGKFGQMYGPSAEVLGRARDAGDDLQMFAHYIGNNIGIGFRCYGGGLLAGLGAALALLFNGLFLGTVEAHVVNLGHGERFYAFVSGHSSFELSAIVLCGAAGLMLGRALLAPGARTRGAALREAGRKSVSIVGGAALMLFVAALLEAFWSPRAYPVELKLAVGVCNWLLVIGWLCLAGRGRAA